LNFSSLYGTILRVFSHESISWAGDAVVCVTPEASQIGPTE